MLKHRCAALIHFSDAETPLKNTGDHFPDAETPLIGTFHFFPVTKTPHSPIIFTPETTPSSTGFAFSPPSAATPFAATFPLVKHRLSANFHPFPPMPKHHCSAYFSSPSHHLSHSPSSTKQFRPAIVSPLLLLKHHLPATLHHSSTLLKHHFPTTFHHFIHDAETPLFSTL
jgi:hypothetical protein